MRPRLQWSNVGTALLLSAISIPLVMRDQVWTDTWTILGIYSLISISAGMSYGQAGILSMSQGAFASMGGYAAAILGRRLGSPFPIDLVLAIAVPAILAFLLARLVSRLTPLATALATLALGAITEIVEREWDSLTGGYIGIAGIPGLPGLSKPIHYCILVWLMLCAWVFVYENLLRSAQGRALNVIRHDRARAEADGINVPRMLGFAFSLSAAIAGSAGWLYAHYITFMSPQSLDAHMSISALLMAVIGGVRSILAPVAGVIVFDTLTRVFPAQQLDGLLYGGVLVAVLIIAPDGIVEAGSRALGRIRDRPRYRETIIPKESLQ